MRMSMADHEAGGADQQSMDVDDTKDAEEDYSEALQDPAFIQVWPNPWNLRRSRNNQLKLVVFESSPFLDKQQFEMIRSQTHLAA